MARLNICKDDEEGELDLSDVATLLRNTSTERTLPPASSTDIVKSSEHHERRSRNAKIVAQEYINQPKSKVASESLNHRYTSSLIATNSKEPIQVAKKLGEDEPRQTRPQIRCTPRRAAQKPVNYGILSAKKGDRRISMSEDDESFTDLSGFIVPDSESDDGDPRKEAKKKRFQRTSAKTSPTNQSPDNKQVITIAPEASDVNNPRLSKTELSPPDRPSLNSNTTSKKVRHLSADFLNIEDDMSQLRFSPPRSRKASRIKGPERPITPTSSPSRSTLGSPSRKKSIPPSPHRPSIDAFWSQDVIDNWNDQFSPKKIPYTPGKNRLLVLIEDEGSNFSPSISPQKSPEKSPNKKERRALKTFQMEKSKLAATFLSELDAKITNNRISNLTDSTGGTKIKWSKKLSSTAGRANWRREAVRRKSPDGTYSEPTYRHHASIELAEKVIDCEDRLINVLAHEFCHLANFMISGVKDQPHGKEFKLWAAKVTRVFQNRGLEVTTKHDYDITYKYIWTCGDCGLEYKRHSKSIDPSKHSCGVCKGKLAQVLPAPRKESEYQRFVRANWDRVKKNAGEGARMGEINGLLAKEWEARKTKRDKSKQLVVEVTEVAESASDESDKMTESSDLDNVARKLDFLTLKP